MKRRSFNFMVGVLILFPIVANSQIRTEGAALGEWTMDIDAAKQLAKDNNKYIFINFTGSDWCGWCKLMDEHVFSQPGWQAWAKENLALAFIDRPQKQELVPEKYRKRNKDLGKAMNVTGFPTFVMLGPDGHEAGRLGASRSGNDYNFITNVIAVIVEDRMAEFVTKEELKEYQEAQAEKAEWEARNSATQREFREKYAIPYQKTMDQINKDKFAILSKAAEKFRTNVAPNEFAKEAEIKFSDFGKGVATNGAAFGEWTADINAAQVLAQKADKDMLIAFVGPNWCEWGNQMESNVFNTVEWMNFAKEHFVQVYIDCPDDAGESRLPEWLVKRNAAVYKAYQMRGCPFYLLTDKYGKRYDAFGATTGITPKEQIAAVEILLARKQLSRLVSAEEYAQYNELVATEEKSLKQWQLDYDKFIADMESRSEEFAPIAEKRNRVFTKALDKYFKTK